MRNSCIFGLRTLSGNHASNAVIAGNASAACHKSFASLCLFPPDNPSLPVFLIIFPFQGRNRLGRRLPVPVNLRHRDQGSHSTVRGIEKSVPEGPSESSPVRSAGLGFSKRYVLDGTIDGRLDS